MSRTIGLTILRPTEGFQTPKKNDACKAGRLNGGATIVAPRR